MIQKDSLNLRRFGCESPHQYTIEWAQQLMLGTVDPTRVWIASEGDYNKNQERNTKRESIECRK